MFRAGGPAARIRCAFVVLGSAQRFAQRIAAACLLRQRNSVADHSRPASSRRRPPACRRLCERCAPAVQGTSPPARVAQADARAGYCIPGAAASGPAHCRHRNTQPAARSGPRRSPRISPWKEGIARRRPLWLSLRPVVCRLSKHSADQKSFQAIQRASGEGRPGNAERFANLRNPPKSASGFRGNNPVCMAEVSDRRLNEPSPPGTNSHGFIVGLVTRPLKRRLRVVCRSG